MDGNVYKISPIVETPQTINLAVMGRYILTPDIFDKIDETGIGRDNEIHLTDALRKLDSLYGVIYEGESYYIENRLD